VALLLCFRYASGAGLAPEETLKRLKPAEGLEVKLSAAEPMVRQPVNLSFDERGRMWVVQYLQYPSPAGLKPVAVDQYLRTKYDRVPDPPPKGPVGKDRITILQDTDGDGVYDQSKDFVTGLNLATSAEVGHGGVWVTQAPYLLFYPDKDRDDVPDSDPRVVLSGFGMEDAHAVVNHLTWGPDGWLYGAQGSTCTANVRGHVFQQAAWRYHPDSDQFEVFSEGGGNTFGLEWDGHGNLLTGTNYNNYVMVHYVQGGYFVKGFAKHGPLSNPYSFGYFDHVPHANWRGGHVTQTGLIYQGGALPARFNGKWIAPNLLANNVDYHDITPDGSSFKTKLVGEFLGSEDKRFRPVDVRTGPDGAVYVADWYDARANHVIPQDTWDKTTGRVYRVAPRGLPGTKPFDLTKASGEKLVALLSDKNDWYARTARRVLSERHDPALVPAMLVKVLDGRDRDALQGLWGLNAIGGFTETGARAFLKHPTADVRAWTVRLLGDAKAVSASTASELAELAAAEPAAVVRAQLACSARRLPADQGLPVVAALIRRAEDTDDRYVPLLLWWAIEAKAASDADAVVALFKSKDAWAAPIARKYLVERLARRFAAGQADAGFAACGKLLELAPDDSSAGALIAGMDKGLEGAGRDDVPRPLAQPLAKLWERTPRSAALVSVALRLGLPQARDEALARAASLQTPPAERAALLGALGDAKPQGAVPTLLTCAAKGQPKEVRAAAVGALQQFDDATIARSVLKLYPDLPADLRANAISILTSRPAWARALLEAIDAGQVDRKDLPQDQVRRLTLLRDPDVDALAVKVYGPPKRDAPDEKKRTVERLRQLIASPGADPVRGKAVFASTCGQCHAVQGEGNRIGPDLTGYDPKAPEFFLESTVDPNAVIRPEYAAYVVETTDGRMLNGPIVGSGPDSVTVEDGTAKITVARSRVKRIFESPVSRMPEGLLDAMPPQQVKDLFAYLAAPDPHAPHGAEPPPTP
jgi:putative membrane-bound dehydrogenase-like protein